MGAGIQGTKRRLGRGREVRVRASSFPSKKPWAGLLAVPPPVRLQTVGKVVREGALAAAEFKIPRELLESRLRFGSRRDCKRKHLLTTFLGGASEWPTTRRRLRQAGL